jgi:hypothetical protein
MKVPLRKGIVMAQHIMPFTLGIIAPVALVGWLLLQ